MIRLTSKSMLPQSKQLAAGQAQVGAIDERLVATILGAVIVDHHEHAFVDILGREEEPVVVRPHGALVLTVVAGAPA